MSWNAYLEDDRGHTEGSWGYTHNTNGMANTVLDASYQDRSVGEEVFGWGDKPPVVSWWRQLDGLAGPAGAAFLNKIIEGLEGDPDRFRAMNPDNGWGDYDGFMAVLREMRDAVPEWPTKWSVHG